jgi:hypothetical protein
MVRVAAVSSMKWRCEGFSSAALPRYRLRAWRLFASRRSEARSDFFSCVAQASAGAPHGRSAHPYACRPCVGIRNLLRRAVGPGVQQPLHLGQLRIRYSVVGPRAGAQWSDGMRALPAADEAINRRDPYPKSSGDFFPGSLVRQVRIENALPQVHRNGSAHSPDLWAPERTRLLLSPGLDRSRAALLASRDQHPRAPL